jgi:hypothetical protein
VKCIWQKNGTQLLNDLINIWTHPRSVHWFLSPPCFLPALLTCHPFYFSESNPIFPTPTSLQESQGGARSHSPDLHPLRHEVSEASKAGRSCGCNILYVLASWTCSHHNTKNRCVMVVSAIESWTYNLLDSRVSTEKVPKMSFPRITVEMSKKLGIHFNPSWKLISS